MRNVSLIFLKIHFSFSDSSSFLAILRFETVFSFFMAFLNAPEKHLKILFEKYLKLSTGKFYMAN